MQHENDNEMTLTEANALLAGIGYREHWTVPELIEATAHLAQDDRSRISAALRVTATAAFLEADRLESDGR